MDVASGLRAERDLDLGPYALGRPDVDLALDGLDQRASGQFCWRGLEEGRQGREGRTGEDTIELVIASPKPVPV